MTLPSLIIQLSCFAILNRQLQSFEYNSEITVPTMVITDYFSLRDILTLNHKVVKASAAHKKQNG